MAPRCLHTLVRAHCSPPFLAGFVSSDYGIHPVATLLRGLLTSFELARVRVICYSLHDEESWWSHNISAGVDTYRCGAVGSLCAVG